MMFNTDCTIFQCPICLEDFDDPKALPCLHSFCRLCIREYILSCRQVTDSVIVFPCPVCRKEVKISTSGDDPVDSLQDNYVIKTLKESSDSEKIRCDIHNSKYIEFLCKCHEEFICSTCLLNNHRHCSVSEINEAISSHRREMEESKRRVDALRKEIRTQMDSLSSKKANVISDTSIARQGIRLYIKEIKSLIAKAELKLMNEIDAYEKDQIKKYDSSISSAEQILVQIDSNTCDSESFKMSKNKDVALMNGIRTKLKKLELGTSSTTVSNLVQIGEELTIRFKPNMELFKILKHDNPLGATHTTSQKVPPVQIDAKQFQGNETSSNLEIRQSILESCKEQENCLKSTDVTRTVKRTQGDVFRSSTSETVKIDFKVSTDKMKCYITGLAVMNEGSFLVADHGNAKLKIFDAECNISQQKVFSSEPWSVCLLNNNKFLVSFPSENLIQSFMYKHNRLAARSTKIETNGRCYGLAINKDKTLAVCVRRPSGSFIAVYANLNELVSEIETSSKPSLSGNWYLTFISDGKSIAYTDECQNSVKCVNSLSGQEMWMKTVSAPKGIACVYGDVFIATHGSNTLKRFAEHDGVIKEDIEVAEITTVSCLALDNDQSHLLVSENEGSRAVMFSLN